MAEQAININSVPIITPDNNTYLAGVKDGNWGRIQAANIVSEFKAIPDINLSVMKNTVGARTKNSILASMRFPSQAAYLEFLQQNPRFVLIRQTGNMNNSHGHTDARPRQKTKRFGYTRLTLPNDTQQEFKFVCPVANQPTGSRADVIWMDGIYSLLMVEVHTSQKFTPERYFSYFGSQTVYNNGDIALRIRRGGIKSRNLYYHPDTGVPTGGRKYASSLIGFQLISNNGRSNIVYVKFKIIILFNKTTNKYYHVYTWSVLP
jgi:hypothetical protein